MERLNPYAKVAAESCEPRRRRLPPPPRRLAGARSKVGQAFYEGMKKESNYEGELFDGFATLAQGQALRGGGGVSCRREQRIVAIVEYQLQQFGTKTTQTTSGGLRRDASRRTHCVILSYTALALHWYDDSASTQSTQCPSDA